MLLGTGRSIVIDIVFIVKRDIEFSFIPRVRTTLILLFTCGMSLNIFCSLESVVGIVSTLIVNNNTDMVLVTLTLFLKNCYQMSPLHEEKQWLSIIWVSICMVENGYWMDS